MIKTERNGLAYVHPGLSQRHATVLARQCLKTFGRPALRTLGHVIGMWDKVQEADGGDMMALAAVVQAALPDNEVESLLDLVTSEHVDELVMHIVHGLTVDGLAIDKGDRASIDAAFDGHVDPWALHWAALWVAREHELFPLPGGSANATGEAEAEAA